MKNNTAIPSLCSYLDPDHAGFALAFFPVDSGDAAEGKAPFPFVTVERSAPLSRVIRARVVTDAGSCVTDIFAVLQKDYYTVSQDPLQPLTNRDVENWWQQAFSFLTKTRTTISPMVLSEQIDQKGRLVRLQSLFYCKHTGRFFPPPCPSCGVPLEQCEDDQILFTQGLSPYSSSLRRYLFCPACFEQAGGSDFYGYALDEEEAGTVKDRWDLIAAFGRLTESHMASERFPCTTCTEARVCYGEQARARFRIVPVCFYPFYMLIVPAMSLKAEDFLALISGCPVEALEEHLLKAGEIGRSACVGAFRKQFSDGDGFVFQGTPWHFLEVLYLKLCFLAGLYRIVGSDTAPPYDPAWQPGLDGIWVKLADAGGLLPAFWHFRVSTIRVEGFGSGSTGTPVPPVRQGLYFMGLAWAFALLVNRRQGAHEVNAALKEALEKVRAKDEGDLEAFCESALGPVCAPENLLWEPEAAAERGIGEAAYTLWKRAMQLGWSLLVAGVRADTAFSHQVFREDFEVLINTVRRELFAREAGVERKKGTVPVSTTAVDDTRAQQRDRTIVTILEGIARRWRAELEAKREPSRLDEAEIPVDQTSGEQTVILAPGAVETKPCISDDDEDARETVILSASDLEGPETRPEPTEPESAEEPQLEETVMISRPPGSETVSSAAPSDTTSKPAMQPSSEEMAETVIVSPAQVGPESGGKAMSQKAVQPSPPDEDMPETVMISAADVGTAAGVSQDTRRGSSPGTQKGISRGSPPVDMHPDPKVPPAETEPHDELAETVILSPGWSKEKGD
ncbi:MAG: hypothetical protein JRI36_05315 [Deltaproteobacteria bacterium]|nr:hypothetical protein [Deltaproteobacteria bacterium]